MDQNKNNQAEAEAREGIITQQNVEPLSTGLDDEAFAKVIGTRVADSEAYWNATKNLKEVREKNEKTWTDEADYPVDLYDYELSYRNNRIFTSIETLIPLVMSQVPEPVVTEANDTEASRELARGLQNVHLGLYDELHLKDKFEMVARHLLIGMRLGAMKYRWDGELGRLSEDGERPGGIAVDAVRPTRLVIEQKTQWSQSEDVPLIAEYQSATVEQLCLKFPKKSDEIIKHFGASKKGSGLSTSVGFLELWFSYYDKQGKKHEGVGWKYNDLVLDNMKNPHYNYDEYSKDTEGNLVYNNFFDRPMKPYIFFNHINSGRFLIDDTSLTEQARSQQEILYKRGLQIVENADMANSGTVFNSQMIKPEDVAKLIGDPDEKVMVDGDVTRAAMRLPQNLLPEYVLRDKYDARNEIDNIFGTNAPLRGENSQAKTLGQEIIAQRSNMSRMQTLANSLETGAGKLYRGLTQMMKVFWDEPTMVKYAGRDGYTLHMEFSGDKIEDGMQVSVKAGSLLPRDEVAERNETTQLAKMLDPLSLAEGLGKKNPHEFAKRVIYYTYAIDKYISEILKIGPDSVDRDAVKDIASISAGANLPVREDPSKEYLTTYANYLESELFKELQPEVQQRHIAFLKATKNQVALALKQEKPDQEAADSSSMATPGSEAPVPGGEPNAMDIRQQTSPLESLLQVMPGGQPS